ncbi:MAG: LON peptidase substrate-binding domain-containing protein, partial [Alphaproteobacteria bacterium]
MPEVLPIFPLVGVLLLPRARLPLNIFEPRYLAMTRDALGGERLIGMIQPRDPPGDQGIGGMNPPVYPVGCAGRITQFAETNDGRFLITLTGVSRFRIVEELPLLSGYRRVIADWKPFERDREIPDSPQVDRPRLVRGLKNFFGQRKLDADWSAIEKAPAEQLIASIAIACPFAPN